MLFLKINRFEIKFSGLLLLLFMLILQVSLHWVRLTDIPLLFPLSSSIIFLIFLYFIFYCKIGSLSIHFNNICTMYIQLKDKDKQKDKLCKSKKCSQVKIWSFNVFLRPPPIKNNNDDYKSQRFSLIIDRIHMYDIICFQELFQIGSFRLEDMIAAGIRQGFLYWSNSDPINFYGPIPVDSGLLVMSKYPILYTKFFSFGLGVFSDSSSDKGYLYCKIDVNGDIIHLFNLHLQASYLTSQKSSYYKQLSLAARRHQVKLLKAEITRHLHNQYQEKDLILLMGDFNINCRSQEELSKTAFIKAFIPQEFHQYQQFVNVMEGKSDNQFVLPKMYRLRQLIFQNYGYHPTTYGEQALMVLTHKDEYGIPQRLDYAFQIQPYGSIPSLIPDIKNCVIDKAKIQGQPFTQLSDHYSLVLKIIRADSNQN